jgi:hypothetical protein
MSPQRKPYNPNTKYGRRKMREQAYQNIKSYSAEERKQYDQIRAGCIIASIIAMIILGIIIYSVSGSEGLRKWLK